MLCRSIVVVIFFGLLSEAALAQEADAKHAEKFLQSVLVSDFKGEPDGRLDHTLYTTPARHEVGPKREVYILEVDPLVIVASWHIGKPRMLGAQEAEFPVDFRVLAVTDGAGVPSWFRPQGRELRAVASPKTESITYRLKYASGHWNLIDPPEPRVGVAALTAFFQHDLKQFLAGHRGDTLSKVGPHVLEDNRLFEQWERRQLDVLASLK